MAGTIALFRRLVFAAGNNIWEAPLAHDCIGWTFVGLDCSARSAPYITITLTYEKYFSLLSVNDSCN